MALLVKWLAAAKPSGQSGPDMSKDSEFATSSWPLPAAGVRFLAPSFLLELLRDHPLSEDCHPLAFGFYPQAAGHQMRREEHHSHLLIFCEQGEGELWVAGQRWPVVAGDLILLPPGQAHAYRAGARPWSIYWVHFAGRLAERYSSFLGMSHPVVHIGPTPRLVAEFEALLVLRQAGFSLTDFVHGACRLKALLTGLAASTAVAGRAGRKGDIEALIALMRQRLDADLSLEYLAAAAGLSRFHLVRKFRELTGHTPIQHFIHLKMQHACQLLDAGDEPVKVVAARLGYDDPYYFSRLFRRVIGLSPQQYRARQWVF
jgi:AraC-like DNA-binding protein